MTVNLGGVGELYFILKHRLMVVIVILMLEKRD